MRQIDELRKLFDDLADPECKHDLHMDSRLHWAAGYRTTLHGPKRQKEGAPYWEWEPMPSPLTDFTALLSLVAEALPGFNAGIVGCPPHMHAAISWPNESITDVLTRRAYTGRGMCHALALAFVAALITQATDAAGEPHK